MQVETINWDDVQDYQQEQVDMQCMAGEIHDCNSVDEIIELLVSHANPTEFDILKLSNMDSREAKHYARQVCNIPHDLVV